MQKIKMMYLFDRQTTLLSIFHSMYVRNREKKLAINDVVVVVGITAGAGAVLCPYVCEIKIMT